MKENLMDLFVLVLDNNSVSTMLVLPKYKYNPIQIKHSHVKNCLCAEINA